MEHTETLRFGHDPDGVSKRRRSSILKAPRPSMKVSAADQDELQEETRSIEKRRISKRVSFAATNNVRVFSKDIKAESPVLASIQNVTAVGANDGQDKKRLRFDSSEYQPITGLDTMLSMSLDISQLNKENFFPDPVLPDECVDKTMLLGEDTGYMNMTHNHTVAIEKDGGIDPEFSFNVFEHVTKVDCQNDLPSKAIISMEKDAVSSEFKDFLASVSKPQSQNIVDSSQKKKLVPFVFEDTKVEMNKENVQPPCFTRQVHCPVNPQPRGLQSRSFSTTLLEQDHMDMTERHTVLIDRIEVAQYAPYSGCGNRMIMQSFLNESDDMEITCNQTANINFNATQNMSSTMSLDVGPNKSDFVSEDTSGMVMTQVLDGLLQEQELKVTSNAVFPQAYAESTAVLETQYRGEPFGKSMNISSYLPPSSSSRTDYTNGREIAPKLPGHLLGSHLAPQNVENKKRVKLGEDTVFLNDQSDLMELTCQANASAMVTLPIPDDMELTECNNVAINPENILATSGKTRKRISFMLPHSVSAETRRVDIHRTSVSIAALEDDMDLTECRTITTDANKSLEFCSLFSKSAMLDEVEMEMTEIVGSEESLQNTRNKSPIVEMHVDAQGLLDNHREAISFMADMDLVKGQTVLIGANKSETSCPSSLKENTSFNLTARSVESPQKDCDMEITRGLTMPFEEPCFVDNKQGEIPKENAVTLPDTTDQRIFQETAHVLPGNNNTVTSVTDGGFATKSELIAVKKDQSKSRRRSLADFQEKLQNITQCFNEPNRLSYTAPIANFPVSEDSPVEKHSEGPSATEPLKETPALENIVISGNTEGTTPFNLKNFLTTRISIGGITPKLPSRSKFASPNQTAPISSNEFHSLVVSQLNGDLQNSNYISSMIDNEELPDEDLSDTVFSYDENTLLAEVAVEQFDADVNLGQPEKIPCEEDAGDENRTEANKKLCHNTSATLGTQNASNHMTKVLDDTCSSSNYTNTKCEGISESTLRSSQLDSQVDRTMDHEFDFNKTLEDGSITVNDFLSHFGANSVIHKSRPSSLPNNFRAAETHTMEHLLREKYIHRPKQRVYEADCQKLTDMVEGFKMLMAELYKPLRDVNETLLQDMCTLSNVQLQRFGAKLKEQRVYFRKRSKALSHELKKVLYSKLLKTSQESKQNLMAKITETNEMLTDLDGCINDLESELSAVSSMLIGDQHCLSRAEPTLKAKQKDVDALNSEVAAKEKQICDLEHQRGSLENTLKDLQGESRELESCITTLNSLNEWRFCKKDENGAVFSFLHNTVHLELKLKKATEMEWMHKDVDQDMDVSFKFLLNGEHSQSHAGMIHQLLAEYVQSQAKWMQKYPTTLHIPVLLHDVSLVVSRLRLLGEEIHELKKCGGLRLRILHITCVDTLVKMMFSSVKAFVKFELSLAISPDYPLSPLQMQQFQNHIGNTRVDQIKDILSSVTPAKNYLTKVIKRIHADILG